MRIFILVFVLSLVFVGCRSEEKSTAPLFTNLQKVQDDYQAALKNATNSIPCAIQFVRFFPKAESGFSYYIGGAGPASFYMVADLYDKYELTMKGPVTFDLSRRKVTGFGEPEFLLTDLAEVKRLPDGRCLVRYNTEGQRRFGAGEWKKIVAAQGDFSAIGYMFITNIPVSGFREYRNGQKTPQR